MKGHDQNPVNGPARVLVVEDDRNESDLLVRQLRGSHFEGHVKIIADGGEAWNFLVAKGSAAHLIAIFLDLSLPSNSAMRLLRKIKSRPQLGNVQVLVMVSSHHSRDMQECIHLGVDDYIAKPVSYGTFTMAVADIFHTSPAHLFESSE